MTADCGRDLFSDRERLPLALPFLDFRAADSYITYHLC